MSSRHRPAAVAALIALGLVATAGILAPGLPSGSNPADVQAMEVTGVLPIDSQSLRVMYVTTVATESRAGYFGPGSPFTIATVKIKTGKYEIGYGFDARHTPGIGLAGALRCALVENESGIPITPQEPSVIRGFDGWATRSASSTIDLPSMTLAIQCSSDRDGLSFTRFRQVSLFAVRIR